MLVCTAALVPGSIGWGEGGGSAEEGNAALAVVFGCAEEGNATIGSGKGVEGLEEAGGLAWPGKVNLCCAVSAAAAPHSALAMAEPNGTRLESLQAGQDRLLRYAHFRLGEELMKSNLEYRVINDSQSIVWCGAVLRIRMVETEIHRE